MEQGDWVNRVRNALAPWCWPTMTDRRVEFYSVPGGLLAGLARGVVDQGRYDGHLVVSEWADPELVIDRVVVPVGVETGLVRWGWECDEEGVDWAVHRPGASSAEFGAQFEH